MNSKLKGTPTKPARGRARNEKNCAKETTKRGGDLLQSSRKYVNNSVASKTDSSLQSESGGVQAPQTWEERAEIDIAYSQYLQTKMLEKLMTKNAIQIENNLENQTSMLNSDLQRELQNTTTLKERLVEVKQLVEEEKILDEILPKTEKLAGKMKELSPLVDDVTEAMYAGTDQLLTNDIKLPSDLHETESLVACLDNLAVENSETQLPGEKIVSELTSLASKLQLNVDQTQRIINNSQKNLLPTCCKQLALLMTHQERKH